MFFRRAALVLIVSIAPIAASACNQTEAEAKWLEAEEAGIILGMRMTGETPTFVAHGPTWSRMKYTTRLGLFSVFECLIAGQGKVLLRALAIDDQGRGLAEWDGRRKDIEVVR